MDKKVTYYLIAYYVVVIAIALVPLVQLINDGYTSAEEQFTLFEALWDIGGIIWMPIVWIVISVIVLFMAIISLVLAVKNELDNIFLIHPIYYILYFSVWLSAFPTIAAGIFSFSTLFGILDILFKISLVLRFFEIGLSLFMLYKIRIKKTTKQNGTLVS